MLYCIVYYCILILVLVVASVPHPVVAEPDVCVATSCTLSMGVHCLYYCILYGYTASGSLSILIVLVCYYVVPYAILYTILIYMGYSLSILWYIPHYSMLRCVLLL